MSDELSVLSKIVLDALERTNNKQDSMNSALAENTANLRAVTKAVEDLSERQDVLEEKLDDAADKHLEFELSFKKHELVDQRTLDQVEILNKHLVSQIERLDKYNEQLEIHIKRTDLLESSLLPILERQTEEKVVSAWKENKYKTIAKWAGGITACVAVATAIIDFVFKIF